MRPTPASTRSSRSAWSCPEPSADVAATVSIAAEEHVPIVPRGAATSLSGQTVGAGDRDRLFQISESDRHRRPRRDDGAGRAGRGARPAQCAPETAGTDVRAGRLDQRPRHDRRDDRQQLGRRSLAPLRQDGRSRAVDRGGPGRRHDGATWARSPPKSSRRSARGPIGRARSSRRARHGRRASRRRSATGFRTSCAG